MLQVHSACTSFPVRVWGFVPRNPTSHSAVGMRTSQEPRFRPEPPLEDMAWTRSSRAVVLVVGASSTLYPVGCHASQ